jgi:hypothetical protein
VHQPTTTRALRTHPLKSTPAALALLPLLLLALIAPARAADDARAPDLGDCEEVQVPAGHKVLFHAYAEGVQIYRWDGTTWVFVAPEAVLYADGAPGNGVVATHYAGPTWESNSGSTVVGAVDVRCPVGPDAIPWLRLKAAAHDGPGIFDRVTYIQRINTAGGTAPTEPGDFPGDEAHVPYTADYYFYRAQH